MMTYITDETQHGAALGYIWDQLDRGKTLARLLLKSVDFETGTVAVLNPIRLSAQEMLDFSSGHVPSRKDSGRRIEVIGQSFLAYPKENSYHLLAELIHSLLEVSEDLCILENMLASAGDSWLKRAKSRVATHGSDVYHILGFRDRVKGRIQDAIRESQSLPVFVGAVGRQPPEPISGTLGNMTISTEQLRAFAKSVRCVFVEAYDGEGFVVWEAPHIGGHAGQI